MDWKELPNGELVATPIDLQIGWMIQRWGLQVLGDKPDIKQIIRSGKALDIYDLFRKSGDANAMARFTPGEWKTWRNMMELAEEYLADAG